MKLKEIDELKKLRVQGLTQPIKPTLEKEEVEIQNFVEHNHDRIYKISQIQRYSEAYLKIEKRVIRCGITRIKNDRIIFYNKNSWSLRYEVIWFNGRFTMVGSGKEVKVFIN